MANAGSLTNIFFKKQGPLESACLTDQTNHSDVGKHKELFFFPKLKRKQTHTKFTTPHWPFCLALKFRRADFVRNVDLFEI